MHFHSEIVEVKWYYVICLQAWKPAGELSSLHIYLSHVILYNCAATQKFEI